MKVNFQRISISILHLQLDNEISGGDALRGHTRSHPEHDG